MPPHIGLALLLHDYRLQVRHDHLSVSDLETDFARAQLIEILLDLHLNTMSRAELVNTL